MAPREREEKVSSKRCLGTLLAHYVKHSHTKDGKEQVIAKGPNCYGVSWKTEGRVVREKNAVTLDAVEKELGKTGVPLKLDWGCMGISSYNTRATSRGGGKVELPQCGGIELIMSNELEFVPDRREGQQQRQQPGNRGKPKGSAVAQDRGKGVDKERLPNPQSVNVDEQFEELKSFCVSFVKVQKKIIFKMGENVGLVAGVFKKTLQTANEEVRKAVFGDEKKS